MVPKITNSTSNASHSLTSKGIRIATSFGRGLRNIVAALSSATAVASAGHPAAGNYSLNTTITAAPTVMTTVHIVNSTTDPCTIKYEEFNLPESGIYCNWTWDMILCWPPTPAGTIARQQCPPAHGIDVTKFAVRRCGLDGKWEGKPGASVTQQNANGWTNYTPCYTPEILQLMKKVYAGGDDDVAKLTVWKL